MYVLEQIRSSRYSAMFLVLWLFFIDSSLQSMLIHLVPNFLWKIHLSTNPIPQATTLSLNITSQANTLQMFEEAKKTFLTTQKLNVIAISAFIPTLRMFGSFFVGPLIDRIGHSVPMFAGTLIVFVTAIGYAVAPSFLVLFVSAAAHGVGSSLIMVGGMTMLARIFNDKEEMEKAIGISLGVAASGAAVGPIFGSLVDICQNRRATFFSYAGVIALLGFFQLFCNCLKVQRVEKNEKIRCLWTLPTDSFTLTALQGFMTTGLVLGSLYSSFSSWSAFGFNSFESPLDLALVSGIGGFQLGATMVNFLPISNKAVSSWPWTPAILEMMIVIIGLFSLTIWTSSTATAVLMFAIGHESGMVASSTYAALSYSVETKYNSKYGSVFAMAILAIDVGYFAGLWSASGIVPVISFDILMWIMALFCALYVASCLANERWIKQIVLIALKKRPRHNSKITINNI
ncbi:unnamed protein product [Clavelina lepadiformis]|uniref:Major facilitator superfamily (MFS) profile domain-containing protein n=1 Tax=Clavelina lepadiformis TaxID=159417 RepID=A0ABP0G7X2_CLALP